MKILKVQEYEILLDDDDYAIFSKLKLYPDVRDRQPQIYFRYGFTENGKWKYKRLHRLIMGDPKGLVVDHINGNTLDNRKSNLRICKHGENRCNSDKHKGTSKYKGVCWYAKGKKWHVQIHKDKKRYHLGYYDNEIEAAKVHDKAAKRLHGEYARLNFNEDLPETYPDLSQIDYFKGE